MENKEQLGVSQFNRARFFIILFLLLIGIALCFDLSYIFYKTNFLESAAPSFCAVNELIDCDGVAKTTYAVSMGVPNSLWGLILYSVIIMLLFVDKIQKRFPGSIFDVFKNPRSYVATLCLLAFAISMILAFISIKVIHKICYLCFCTYFVDFFIAITAMHKGLFISDIKTTVLDVIDGAKKHFILFLVVSISMISLLIYLDKTMLFSPKLKKERQLQEFFKAESNKYAIKGNVLGNKKAKVVINVYSDYNCPFCKVVNIMLHKAAKEQKILVEDVNFPLDTSCNSHIGTTLGGHENSCLYSRYAFAAKKQGKLWGVADILFYKQPKTEDELIEYIKKAHLNIDINQFKSDINSPEIAKQLQEDMAKAASKGLYGTPAIEINDVMYMGAMPYDDLVAKIKAAQKRAEQDENKAQIENNQENKTEK